MIDHAEIVIGDWAVSDRGEHVVTFEDAIPEIFSETRTGIPVPVFTTTSRSPDGRWMRVEVSKGRPGNVAYQTRPIIGGELAKASGEGRVPRHTSEHIRFGLDAHLNCNNFLMAQSIIRGPELNCPVLQMPLAMAIGGAFAAFGSEHCLTDATNVLIGPAQLYRYVQSKLAEDHFMEYLRLIETFLTTQFHEVAQARPALEDLAIRHWPYYSLRKIEFVWEFSHPNPIRFVESLDVPMRALGTNSGRHRALVRGERFGVTRDSLSVSVELSGGCRLIVYAKTNERIRFEVRLDRDAIAAMLRKGRDDASRTARSHGQLREILVILREGATEKMQTALAMLDRQRVPPASDVTALQLCAEVGRILQDDGLAHTVLETLRMRGSLASPHGSPMKQAALQLKDEGVLDRFAPRSEVFVPTDRYVRAVRELRGGRARKTSRIKRPAGTPVTSAKRNIRFVRRRLPERGKT